MTKYIIPKKSGTYTLILELSQPIKRKIGKLGYYRFPKGLYTYTGSAGSKSSNLSARINRHLVLRKKEHWHIDYLLNSYSAGIKVIIYLETCTKVECLIAKKIGGLNGTNIIVRGFGSSDCLAGCMSHLHYLDIKLEDLITRIVKLYEKFGFAKIMRIEEGR
jgi:Uri superfamily endonuclease